MTATCQTCGSRFDVADKTKRDYPGWTPKQCRACWKGVADDAATSRHVGRPRKTPMQGQRVEDNLTIEEVLSTYSGGPSDGVFTDGSANPNPGPGGWGAVYVVRSEIVDQRHGQAPDTTNNRMELSALAAGVELVPIGVPTTIYTDSRLAVDTLTTWAAGWQAKGWTRKGGPIKNLDLIKPLFATVQSRPELTIEWIAAHSGNRWNEYADSLSTAYLRDRV
jgi:ribonuclease HI